MVAVVVLNSEKHVGGRVVEITLSRPDSYNAITRELLDALIHEIDAAMTDDTVAAVVIGAQGRAFCAGQDLTELVDERDLPHGGNDTRLRDGYAPLAKRLYSAPKPVVAAVNGVAAGAGLALAALCTTRIATSRASFAPAFIDIGLVPDTGLSYTLPELIGASRALRWLIDGRRIDAETALAWGLVDALVPDDELMSEAVRTADRLGSRDRRAVAATEELLLATRAAGAFSTAVDAETARQIEATGRPEFDAAISRIAG